jgi:hypothetical protein
LRGTRCLSCNKQIWIAIELVFVYVFYVETKGPTLEEVAKMFDGDDAAVAHIDMGHIEKGKDSTEMPRVVATERMA